MKAGRATKGIGLLGLLGYLGSNTRNSTNSINSITLMFTTRHRGHGEGPVGFIQSREGPIG